MLDNPGYIASALYDLGGAGRFVDVEDIFYRAYELAPGRFGWRTKDLPNYKTLYKALRDFEASKPDCMLKTRDGLARQLTAAGVDFVESGMHSHRLVSSGRLGARQDLRRILAPVLASAALRDFRAGRTPTMTVQAISEMLLTAPDSPKEVWQERLNTYRSAARRAQRDDLVQFLDYVASSDAERFGGGSRP